MDTLLIKNVRLAPRWPGGDAVDVLCRHGLITQVGPGINAPDIEIVEGNGEILIPAFSDVHAHLDSTRLGLPFRPHTADRNLESLIENDRSNWRSAEKSVTERALPDATGKRDGSGTAYPVVITGLSSPVS